MQLSTKLVTALKSWAHVKTPICLFHGCRSTDHGVNVIASSLSGNKWFSQDPYYAGEYAWNTCTIGEPVRATVQLRMPLLAVECPVELQGLKFSKFLADCFPNVNQSYALSRHFQDVLTAHLQHAFGNSVHAYLSHNGDEILLPDCGKWIDTCEFQKLPATKDEYREKGGLLYS